MNKEKSFEVIRRHVYEDPAIELTEQQRNMFERWNYAIELRTCEMLKTKDIIQKLIERFATDRATAFNDVSYAEALYGYNITINKRFRIAARIEFLEEYIDTLKTAGEHKAAAAQEANLIRWYEQYPDLKKPQQPRMMRFSYNSTKPLVEDLPTVEDAEYELLKAVGNG